MVDRYRGFTLIEILVVMTIIGVLSAMGIVTLQATRARARDAKRKADLHAIMRAIEMYQQNNEGYPANASDCAGATAGRVAGPDAGGVLEGVCVNTPVADGSMIYLQAIPAPPVTGEQYFYEGDASVYCVSADLETEGYFVCTSGGCQVTLSACAAL